MFAVMEWTEPKKRGFFARRRIKKRGAYPVVERKSVGGAEYYSIKAEKSGKLNLSYLRSAAGELRRAMLLPKDLILPENCGITPFDDSGYRVILLLNAARYLIEGSRLPADKIRLGLFDPTGRCAASAVTLLKYAESVRVASPREDIYSRYSLIALDNYGAQFIYGKPDDAAELFAGCTAILAPFGLSGIAVPANSLIFSGNPADGEYSVNCDCIRLPAPFRRQLPPGIDPVSFAAALRESAPLPVLNSLVPDFLTRRGDLIPIHKILTKYFVLDNGVLSNYNVSIS